MLDTDEPENATPANLALASPGRRPTATSSPLDPWIASYRRWWPAADRWVAGTTAVAPS